FVLASGNPGSTNRLLTIAQLQYQRDAGNPLQMHVWTTRRDILGRYAQRSPEAARQVGEMRRSLENSIKRLVGQQNGLMNAKMMAKKQSTKRRCAIRLLENPSCNLPMPEPGNRSKPPIVDTLH